MLVFFFIPSNYLNFNQIYFFKTKLVNKSSLFSIVFKKKTENKIWKLIFYFFIYF